MMETSSKASESRVARMAATRPSIMSLGETMSAPASAWHRAWRQRTSTESSLRISIVPSERNSTRPS